VAEIRGLAGATVPARKIFSSLSLKIFNPFLETKSQKENSSYNVI
jgi:hypothetical protein